MNPNIIIGGRTIPSWYAMLAIGVIAATALAIYARPKDFPLSRTQILTLGIFVILFGLLGARILFIILNRDIAQLSLREIFSFSGGFAYFGALVLDIFVFWAYARLRKIKFLSLVDYCTPFLMLSQVFVRVGCFLAGCCYGKPTGFIFGVAFKSVDKVVRHPTQIYEAVLLLAIYWTSRIIYEKRRDTPGYTFSITLILYGVGRFLVEFFRADSPAVIFNITVAQVACLSLALLALAILPRAQK